MCAYRRANDYIETMGPKEIVRENERFVVGDVVAIGAAVCDEVTHRSDHKFTKNRAWKKIKDFVFVGIAK